jgi:phasin family protein
MAAAKKESTAFDGFSALDADAFKDGYGKFAKGLNTLADFNKNSMEAFMTSASVVGKGFETAAATQTSFAKEAYEDGVSAVKAASTTKSIQEALEIQTEYVRSAMEKNLSFATKLADIWSGVAKEASDPISKHYAELVEKAQSFRP